MSPVDEALALAGMGFLVFALSPKSKTPPKGSRGHLSASTSAQEISFMFSCSGPHSNVGIRPSEGVWVLDIDPTKSGIKSVVEMQRAHERLPLTVTCRTGSGGWHAYFRGEARQVQSLMPGIDTRTHQGYVVAPPSVHPSGGRYRWVHSPATTPIAVAPPWLAQIVAPPPVETPKATWSPVDNIDVAVRRARAYLAKVPPAVSGAGGHTQTFRAATDLVRGFCLDEETSFRLLWAWNETCVPPWSERDLRRKIAQAAQRSQASPGHLLHAHNDAAPAR